MTKTELIEFKIKTELILETLKYDQRNYDDNQTVKPLNANTIDYQSGGT